MVKILRAQVLGPQLKLLELDLPKVARKAQPGQFVIVRADEDDERLPLTIADFDRQKGSITIIVQEVGAGTIRLCRKQAGDQLAGVAGPLGEPTHIEKVGTAVCIGGGVGIACVYPIARGYKQAGNQVISIIGARNQDLLIYQDKLQATSDRLLLATDDGSAGTKGFVTDVLQELIDSGQKVDLVFAVGPTVMMQAVTEATRPHAIPTWVSLNPIMVDGTGMCGGCRVSVGGEVRYACVDGPDFDAHQVDFQELMFRQRSYRNHESCRLEAEKAKV